MKASGDPHLVNVYGQRFDLAQSGIHTMLLIPRWAEPHGAVLGVVASAEQHGVACADMYLVSLNITGRWVERRLRRDGGVERFFASRPPASANSTGWMEYGGRVRLKVAWGRTSGGVRYLNLLARGLTQAGERVGGLLGEDDHTREATPSAGCRAGRRDWHGQPGGLHTGASLLSWRAQTGAADTLTAPLPAP